MLYPFQYENSWPQEYETFSQRQERMEMEKLYGMVEPWVSSVFRSKHYKARVLRAKARKKR